MSTMDAMAAGVGWRREFGAVVRDVGVVWAGLLALGVGFGVLVTGYGLPWWLAPLMSAVIFAGSAEFLLAGILAAGAPVAVIATTTFLVNSRHLFYGLSFPLDRIDGRIAKMYSIFALCDEAYAIVTTSDPEKLSSRRITWIQAGLHLSWASGALIGGLVGMTMLRNLAGLDFVLTALFIVLALDTFRAHRDRVSLAFGIAAAVIARVVAPHSMLLVAMTVLTVLLGVRHLADRRRRHG